MEEFYKDAKDAIPKKFEPKTPCRQFETRACIKLFLDDSRRYRVNECPLKSCVRFRSRYQKDPEG